MKLKTFVTILISVFFWSFSPEVSSSEPGDNTKQPLIWNVSEFLKSTPGVRISGNPQMIETSKGKAVKFNGVNDGILLDDMPLAGLAEFTIEAIFCPASGGSFEQRFFHSGEIRGDRVLLELRTTASNWYFDAFVQSGYQKVTLIDSQLLHPLDQWHHVAYVVCHGKLATYVNGQKELQGTINFSPVQTGKTSVGVRLNEQSWFKGAISKIRISPRALSPEEFLVL